MKLLIRLNPRLFASVFIACLLLLSPLTAQSAIGDLDPSFGTGGRVKTDLFGKYDTIRDAAVQPDGKIVAVGPADNADPQHHYALVRYLENGSLDLTFATNGKVILPFDLNPTSVLVQPDGEILVGGGANQGPQSKFSFALERFDQNGYFEETFGNNGIATADFFTLQENIWDIALQPDGKIVAVGSADHAAFFPIARFNSDGSLDQSFGSDGDGMIAPAVGASLAQGLAVTLQPDGKIVAVGWVDNFSLGRRHDFALVRINPNGLVDDTFGDDGVVNTDFTSEFDIAYDVVAQPDGKIVVAGEADFRFALARYNADGSLDQTFGQGGKVKTDFFGRSSDARALLLQADGKIIAGGDAVRAGGDGRSPTVQDFALARYNTDGSLDPSFGNQGIVTTGFKPGYYSGIAALILQPSGKLVAAGFTSGLDNTDFALARYSLTKIGRIGKGLGQ